MPMKVYGPALSTNVARILVCCEEVDAECELLPLDMTTESRAISKYVLRKGGSELLRESNLSQSAVVDVWLRLRPKFSTLPCQLLPSNLTKPIFMGGTPNGKIVEENVVKLNKTLEIYETRLSNYRYLAGDFISLADLSHTPMLRYLLATPYASVVDADPHVRAWIMDIMERPCVKVTELMKILSPK